MRPCAPLVKDINAGAVSYGSPTDFIEAGSIVFFTADDGTNGRELGKSDGTPGGTSLVKDIYPGTTGSNIRDMRLMNGKIYFIADDGADGEEIWMSDGTPSGMTILKDIFPGAGTSAPGSLKVIGTNLYFHANDNTNGDEPWKSDGTTTGTNMLVDINSGPGSSNAADFAQLGSWIYFGAQSLTGKNYYRLKQTDTDSRFTYSQVRWVGFSKEKYTNAYPNPTQDVLYINTGYVFKDATMNIRSMNGQLVKQQKISGSGTIHVAVKELAAGLYNIEIVQPGQVVKIRFIKQ